MACDVAPVRAATPGAAWEAPTASPEEDPSERRSFWGHSSVLQILLSVCPSQERAPFFNESSGQARSGGTLALAHMVDRDMDALFWWGKQHWVVRCWARCVSLLLHCPLTAELFFWCACMGRCCIPRRMNGYSCLPCSLNQVNARAPSELSVLCPIVQSPMVGRHPWAYLLSTKTAADKVTGIAVDCTCNGQHHGGNYLEARKK